MNQAWLRAGVPGLLLGYTLSRLGFTEFRELHRMLVLRDMRLLLAFGAAVLLVMVGFRALRRGSVPAGAGFHPGLVPGAMAFGVGWAVTGACPGVVLAQLGQGNAMALLSLAGILVGSWAADRLGYGAAEEEGSEAGVACAEGDPLSEKRSLSLN